jgi:hypothetical protein
MPAFGPVFFGPAGAQAPVQELFRKLPIISVVKAKARKIE